MKIMITGAGGVVGSALIEELFSVKEDVVDTYSTPTTNIKEIDSRIRMIDCDVRDTEKVESIMSDFLSDIIYHLAAQSRPPISWEKPSETIGINVNCKIHVFESVLKLRKKFSSFNPVIVVACSGAAYGESISMLSGGPENEHDELLPLSSYGVSKASKDLLSFQYNHNYGLRTIRARIFNTNGSKKTLDITGDFTYRAIKTKKEGKHDIRCGNLETIRAFLDVRDLNSALEFLAKKGVPGEAYNICSGSIIKMSEIIPTIQDILGYELHPVFDRSSLRPSDEKLYAGDCTKLIKATGWKQKYSYRETLINALAYWEKVL